jgi:hypothetical protein
VERWSVLPDLPTVVLSSVRCNFLYERHSSHLYLRSSALQFFRLRRSSPTASNRPTSH